MPEALLYTVLGTYSRILSSVASHTAEDRPTTMLEVFANHISFQELQMLSCALPRNSAAKVEFALRVFLI